MWLKIECDTCEAGIKARSALPISAGYVTGFLDRWASVVRCECGGRVGYKVGFDA